MPEDLPSEAEATGTIDVVTETITLHKTPNSSIAGNSTRFGNQEHDRPQSMWGKWKHMMEDVKIAMAKLIAKLQGETSKSRP